MLAAARAEHPTAHIVIKTHPETQLGYRAGHFSPEALDDDMELLTHAIAPKISLPQSGPSIRSLLKWDLKPYGRGTGQWSSDNRSTLDRGSPRICNQYIGAAALSHPRNYLPGP